MTVILKYKDKPRTYLEVDNTPTIRRDVNLRVPMSGNFYQLLHDSQMASFEYKPRQFQDEFQQFVEVPATRDITDKDPQPPSAFVYMTESWQRRQLELMDWNNFNRSVDSPPEKWFLAKEKEPLLHKPQDWCPKGTPNALPFYYEYSRMGMYQRMYADHVWSADGHAWNTYGSDKQFRDYIMNTYPGRKPWAQKIVHMTGNLVKVIPVPLTATDAEINVSKINHFIDALDATKPAPSLEWILENKSHCIVWGTSQSTVKLPDGRYVVADLPHMGKEVGSPYFFLAKKPYCMIKKSYVRKVGNGEVYSPYVPEK